MKRQHRLRAIAGARSALFTSRVAAFIVIAFAFGATPATAMGVSPAADAIHSADAVRPVEIPRSATSATPEVVVDAPQATLGHTAAIRTLLPSSVDDFSITSFDAAYELGRDSDGRSTLHTVERIEILFPEFDQNRGFIRDIPRLFLDEETDLQVISVTDETGAQRSFTTEDYNEFLAITIAVPEGSYVHGSQIYIIEYTQRDVTRLYPDTGVDEFYWDVNGTGWAQPFGQVTARLTLSDDILSATRGVSCYRGVMYSNNTCAVSQENSTLIAQEQGLGPHENVTLVVAFEPGTFTQRPAPFFERYPVLFYAGMLSLFAGITLLIVTFVRARRGPKRQRAIIAHYEPPTGVSVALAAEILRVQKTSMTATLLDLAVRRNIRLLRDEATRQYGAQALSTGRLLLSELSVFKQVFGVQHSKNVTLGQTVWFNDAGTRIGNAATKLTQKARSEAATKALKQPVSRRTHSVIQLLFALGLVLPIVHAFAIGNFSLAMILIAFGVNLLIFSLALIGGRLSKLGVLTAAGAELRDYLLGLREYIRLAEADRIRMLQSATGVEVDQQKIVQVYERLLPYAVIFKYEDEWQSELERYYLDGTPDWFAGTAGSFTHSLPLTTFHSYVASRPVTQVSSSGSSSGSSFSSSSGGSSGGGFSGGGGGGGGGRGV